MSFTKSAVYPRVGGGTRYGLIYRIYGLRSIPAWAGEPGSTLAEEVLETVYPRVGGGTWRYDRFRVASAGLSPRGRGNLAL